MSTIIVKTQAELDALPDSFSEFTYIQIQGGTRFAPIIVRKARGSSHVEAWGSSHVEAWGSSHVVAWGSSHVVAWGSSHVVARGSSHVVARGSSHVVAWESSHVEARESSHVEARGSSHVVARGSSHVEARGSSHVVARGSSHVEAWGSSHVVARDSVAVHNHSTNTTLEIGGFVVAWLLAKAAKIKKTGNAQTVTPKRKAGVAGWLESEAVKAVRGKVVLFKRVSKDWKTQEGTSNETTWAPGTDMGEPKPAWNPTSQECGSGKFHACSRGYFCDEFRSTAGDRYVAIEVAVADLHAWKDATYPHKIAFRTGRVLFECDKFGKEVKS